METKSMGNRRQTCGYFSEDLQRNAGAARRLKFTKLFFTDGERDIGFEALISPLAFKVRFIQSFMHPRAHQVDCVPGDNSFALQLLRIKRQH
jgi:hypothetical protein